MLTPALLLTAATIFLTSEASIMATVKYAAHISEIHGSIQNATYSRNRLGPFLKIKRVGIDRRTGPQISRRNIHAACVLYWHSSMDEAHRIAWNDLGLITTFYNKASIPYHPSGFNLFMRANTFTYPNAYATILPDAPLAAAQAPPDLLIVAYATAGIWAQQLNSWPGGATGILKFFVSPALSTGRFTYSGTWYSTTWFAISAFDDPFLLTYICPSPPGAAGQRISIMAKATTRSGDGNCISWPLVLNTAIIADP